VAKSPELRKKKRVSWVKKVSVRKKKEHKQEVASQKGKQLVIEGAGKVIKNEGINTVNTKKNKFERRKGNAERRCPVC